MGKVQTFPLFLISIFILQSCAVKPKTGYVEANVPPAPDYSNPRYWAALPDFKDKADSLPDPTLSDNQRDASADVFFLHPTTYTGNKKGHNLWNGPLDDPVLNQKTDNGSILYQASIFNGAGKIYAPRYRQAHLQVYFTEDKATARRALDLAYLDVKAAFEYYLKNYNNGRPVIIASHSQGTTHAMKLVKEYFDDQPEQERLIVAYLVGIPVPGDYFKSIPPCDKPDDTGCFCSWQTYKKGHYPKHQKKNSGVVATNPLTWTTSTEYAPKSLNEGGILRNFNKKFPALADAQVHDGLLWISKPKFPGSFFVWTSRYHIVDYNLYYYNVRKNAMQRVDAFLNQ